jgi:hypothetical protein
MNHKDRDTVLDLVGYTPEQKELAEYHTTNLLKRLVNQKYQDVKTSLSLMTKQHLALIGYYLLLENYAITQIIVHNVNEQLKDGQVTVDQKEAGF